MSTTLTPFLNLKVTPRLCLLYALFLGLSSSFIACNSSQGVKRYQVVFSQCTTEDAWRQAMYRELAFHPEIDFEILDAKGDSERQVEQIEGLIGEGIDLLIVSPNEAAPITPAVEKAFSTGIPTIVIDRKTDSDLFSVYIRRRQPRNRPDGRPIHCQPASTRRQGARDRRAARLFASAGPPKGTRGCIGQKRRGATRRSARR